MTKEEHDYNLEKFLEIANRYRFTFNENKSIICATSIRILGYLISQNSLRPDPERMQPLRDLPLPTDMKSLK